VPGSSDYFLFSGVTYSNAAKVNVLGVPPQTLETCGAVHEDTVRVMARGAARLAGADYAVATSGIAGPAGGSSAKPVGTLCVGLATPDGDTGRRFHYSFGRRTANKLAFAMTALDVLRRSLLNCK
jgi:nicotinamide-nucleotide amidase